MSVATSLPSDAVPERAPVEGPRQVADLDEGRAADIVDEVDPDDRR